MRKNILIYSKYIIKITELLPDNVKAYIVNGTDITQEFLETDTVFDLFIMDAKTILTTKFNVFKSIKSHVVFKDLPILAYTNKNSFEIKTRLFSLGINGIFGDEFDKINLDNYMTSLLLHSSKNIGSNRDRFIKSLQAYEHCNEEVETVLYLANYLIYNYRTKIDRLDATYIRDSIKIIYIGLIKNRLDDIVKIIYNMNISDELCDTMYHYNTPKNLKDNIILSTLLMYKSDYKVDIEKLINFNLIDTQVYTVAKDAKVFSKTIVNSYRSINDFWAILNQSVNEDEKFSLKIAGKFLHEIFQILNRTLINKGGLFAQILKEDEYILVDIEPFNCNIKNITDCMQEINIYKKDIVIGHVKRDDGTAYIQIKLYYEDATPQIKPEAPIVLAPKISINTTSAIEYCQDIGVDNELLADMDDISNIAQNALFCKENLDDKIVLEVIKSLEKYISLFNTGIEFEVISSGFIELKTALENISAKDIDYDLQVSINHFLSGTIEDLHEWAKHMFILQDAQDIHYMDNSMINNCKFIATMINPHTDLDENMYEDEDEVEFF